MYKISIGDREYEVVPRDKEARTGSLNGADFQLDIAGRSPRMHVLRDGRSYEVSVVKADYATKTFRIRVNFREYELHARDRYDLLLEELGLEDLAAGAVGDLKAPMPGMVLEVHVQPGDEVQPGDPLVVLEAMKMENLLKAETEATVKAVEVEKGQAVEKNFVLVSFES